MAGANETSRSTAAPPPFSYVLADCAALAGLPESAFARIAIDGDLSFCHTRDLDFGVAHSAGGDFRVAIFGLVVDVEARNASNEAIAARLAGAIAASFVAFLDALDDLAGRFVVVFKRADNGEIGVCSDATGMLKVNYREDGRACSSNLFLLTAIAGAEPTYRPEFVGEGRKLWKFGALGNLSPFRGYKILTPNHYLNLANGKVVRYFPRAPLAKRSAASIAEEFREICDFQISALSERHRLYHALSAGIDSRFSLALSASRLKEIVFFTYLENESHLVDFVVGGGIAKALGLNHYGLIIEPRERFPAGIESYVAKVVDPDRRSAGGGSAQPGDWSWYAHIPKMIPAYRALVANTSNASDKPPLHIRSTLYEIGRSYWGKRSGLCEGDASILTQTRTDWADDALASAIFRDFFQETTLQSASLFGFDQIDMFYWEHRCATWGGEVLAEIDFAFNSHVLVNCRRLLKLMLSLEFEERIAARLLHETINQALPPIRDLAVNPSLETLGFDEAWSERAETAAFAGIGAARSPRLRPRS
jgi:hypothetical protein